MRMLDKFGCVYATATVLAGALCGCGTDAPRPKGPELLEFVLAAPLAEISDSPWGDAGATHRELLERLREAADDDQVTGLLLRVGEMQGAFARVEDMEQALSAVRKAGKPVHCYVETTDNLGYSLLARSCDRISVTPGGLVNLIGPRAEALFARDLLSTIGLTADLVQIGRFKGAIESFTRTDMTEETRETLNLLLDQLYARLVEGISKGRSLTADRVRALIDEGPFTAQAALEAKLVDDIGFDDEARAHAKQAAKAQRVRRAALDGKHEMLGLGALLHALRGREEKPLGKAHVVLAYLDGTILQGDENAVKSAHAVPFVAAMRRFGDDEDVRAVVLRINSPGGSALASDLMWHAVRRVAKRKPVIVSIGDMAASGGYYVASAGTEILARSTSLVGSIGVIGGKVVVEDLASKVGVRVESLQRGRNAGWTSSFARFSDAERAAVTRMAQSTYQQFVGRVAEGRKLERKAVERWAEGRLLSGSRALEARLVDREGGLDEALALARERAQLSKDAPVDVWPREQSLFEALSQFTGVHTSGALLERALATARLPSAGLVEVLLADEARVAAVLPWVLHLR